MISCIQDFISSRIRTYRNTKKFTLRYGVVNLKGDSKRYIKREK